MKYGKKLDVFFHFFFTNIHCIHVCVCMERTVQTKSITEEKINEWLQSGQGGCYPMGVLYTSQQH